MKICLKLANNQVPFKVTNFDIDFEDRLGTFSVYADFSIDAINSASGESLIERQVDYPYILNHPNLIYKLLENNRQLWLTNINLNRPGLFHYIMLRFRDMYEKGKNPGGFEISTDSKWRMSSISFTGLSLEGDASKYDLYFSSNMIKLKVFGEFALREV